MKETCEPPLKVTRLEDVLSVVPYLIGFHPHESVVALVMVRGVVAVSARWDLPAGEQEWRSLHQRLNALQAQFDGSSLGLLVFSADGGLARYLLAALGSAYGHDVLFGIASDESLWWSSDDLAGPGRPVPAESSVIAASAVLRGMSALPTRERLAASYEPLPPATAEIVAVERARLRRMLRRRSLANRYAALDDLARRGPSADEDELVRAGIILGTERPWIHAWRSLTLDDASARQELWHAVLVRTMPADAPPVYALLGIASWLTGDGASAAICLEKGRLLRPGGGCGLDLLDLMIDAAVPPDRYGELRRSWGP
ncbi:DUF4192 domain-containing protein [Propionicicella superfundia]|uniref:DUF4192 domain-containing protein n=1 Tax=Propionicicella superfundia TaxID=348582 RepID=UPI00042665EF|nr:DUF4192 domain-containing protein [Propionicicella superfundia]